MGVTHYEVKINEQTYTIAAELEGVTFGEFVKFRHTELSNPYELLRWAVGGKIELTDTPRVEKEIAGALVLIDRIANKIFNFMESDERKNRTPEKVEILGSTIKLKKGLLSDLPYWPYAITKNIIAKEREKEKYDPTDRFNEVVAHYLYTAATGYEYREARAAEFKEVIDDLPFTTVIQLGNFFLKRLPSSLKRN